MRSHHLLAILSAGLMFAGCATQEPAYKGIDHFTVSNVLKEPRVDMDMHLYNPNPIGGTIRALEVQVIVDNKVLGTAQLDEKVRVRKQSEFTMPVSFTTDIGSMGSILSSGLKAFIGDDTMPVGLTGSITVQKFLIFRKTFSFDYSDGLKAREILQK